MWLVKIAYRLCWYIRWNGIKVSTKDISNTRFPRPPSNFQPLVLFSPHTHAKMHRSTLAPQTLLRNYVLFVLFCCISSAESLLWFRNQNQFHSCTHARKYKVREHIDVDFLPIWHQIQNFEFGWCSYEIVIFHVVHCSMKCIHWLHSDAATQIHHGLEWVTVIIMIWSWTVVFMMLILKFVIISVVPQQSLV